jgi:hypothetical protein
VTLALAVSALALAALPAVMTAFNLIAYRAPRSSHRSRMDRPPPAVSLLIPARNEEQSIGEAVSSALASREIELEIIVMDDGSEDGTAEVVRRLSRRDSRVRLAESPALPEGWNGKQHACACLAAEARHPVLVFIDADVRLSPDALRRIVDELDRSGADLLSGIPRQLTGTLAEKLVVPLIHFVLLGFLPIHAARRSRRPAFAAGCGQLFAARADAYAQAGGHGAIRSSRHDGLKLPRAFRSRGLVTDLFDATGVAVCRMYSSAGDLWRGFAKNADEAMATRSAIVPWTVLLLGGQVAPLLLLPVLAAVSSSGLALWSAALAVSLGYGTRLILAIRFRQSILGALLHPLGVSLIVAIQWYALFSSRSGRRIEWKGRAPVEDRT